MNVLRHAVVERVVALVLGLVFVYASHDKIWKRTLPAPSQSTSASAAAPVESGPAAFARVVYRYQVIGPNASLPPQVANVFAVTLPWIELLCGLLLIAGWWRREAALVCAVMLFAFVLAVASTLARGIDVENCGCFSLGPEGRHAGGLLIASDLALMAGALLLVVRPARAPGR